MTADGPLGFVRRPDGSPVFIHGYLTLTQQMFDETQRAEAAFDRLNWVATHYDEASPEDRAWLDRVNQAMSDREEDDDW